MAVLFKNADITIYNRYYDNSKGADMYKRTVVKDVNWQDKKTGTVSNNGLLLADSTLIFIDKLENYVSPKKFAKLQLSEMENYFTFQIGDKIVKGEVEFEITGIKPHRVTDLENEFDDVVEVKSVSVFSGHFQVEGV